MMVYRGYLLWYMIAFPQFPGICWLFETPGLPFGYTLLALWIGLLLVCFDPSLGPCTPKPYALVPDTPNMRRPLELLWL